jgi:hypothetical protein
VLNAGKPWPSRKIKTIKSKGGHERPQEERKRRYLLGREEGEGFRLFAKNFWACL